MFYVCFVRECKSVSEKNKCHCGLLGTSQFAHTCMLENTTSQVEKSEDEIFV